MSRATDGPAEAGVRAETDETESMEHPESAESADRTVRNETAESEDDVRAHLADVEDGCGCAEVWEHLSAGRGE